MRSLAALVLVFAGLVLVVGCAKINSTKGWTQQEFYQAAQQAMENEDYKKAIEYYESMEARYPYGRYAEQAQLEIAYAYFKNGDVALAMEAADRFIRLHPTHPHVAYAYYLKGLVNVRPEESKIASLLRLSAKSATERDAKAAQQAYAAFREVVERFPDSQYARDAAVRMSYLHNSLANHEIEVARFYLDRQAYVAAVNRCKFVLENYQRTPAVEDALGIQAEAYRQMGLTNLAQDTLRVLSMNFPKSEYLNPSKDKKKKKKKKKKTSKEDKIIRY
ncbi:MAG: outer membrane protein assembly factor BamD [Acidiferrobacterales bacterium]